MRYLRILGFSFLKSVTVVSYISPMSLMCNTNWSELSFFFIFTMSLIKQFMHTVQKLFLVLFIVTLMCFIES